MVDTRPHSGVQVRSAVVFGAENFPAFHYPTKLYANQGQHIELIQEGCMSILPFQMIFTAMDMCHRKPRKLEEVDLTRVGQ